MIRISTGALPPTGRRRGAMATPDSSVTAPAVAPSLPNSTLGPVAGPVKTIRALGTGLPPASSRRTAGDTVTPRAGLLLAPSPRSASILRPPEAARAGTSREKARRNAAELVGRTGCPLGQSARVPPDPLLVESS